MSIEESGLKAKELEDGLTELGKAFAGMDPDEAPKEKPYTVAITVTLYYEFPKGMFPTWANSTSVAHMVEEAIDDYNRKLSIAAFGEDGVLSLNPVEISVERVMEA